jgi:hypothetical protein
MNDAFNMWGYVDITIFWLYTRILMVETLRDLIIPVLTDKLKLHHSIYRLPCTSEFLEELISDSLHSVGYTNDWKPNRSHSVSVDMNLDIGPSFSVKSGIYDDQKQTLTFSGSRLGKHKTLDEMIKTINETSADYYICVAKREQDWSTTPTKSEKKYYYVFVFRSDLINYNAVWDTKDSGVYFMGSEGLSAKIVPSMSHQLWTTVSTDIVGYPVKLEI